MLVLFCVFAYSEPSASSDRTRSSGYEPARALLDPELAQIPPDVLACYADRRLWDRFGRLPMSVDSLSAIIRKVGIGGCCSCCR